MITYGQIKDKKQSMMLLQKSLSSKLEKNYEKNWLERTYKQKAMNINWSVSRNIFFCHEKTQFIKEFIFDLESVFDTREKDKKKK